MKAAVASTWVVLALACGSVAAPVPQARPGVHHSTEHAGNGLVGDAGSQGLLGSHGRGVPPGHFAELNRRAVVRPESIASVPSRQSSNAGSVSSAGSGGGVPLPAAEAPSRQPSNAGSAAQPPSRQPSNAGAAAQPPPAAPASAGPQGSNNAPNPDKAADKDAAKDAADERRHRQNMGLTAAAGIGVAGAAFLGVAPAYDQKNYEIAQQNLAINSQQLALAQSKASESTTTTTSSAAAPTASSSSGKRAYLDLYGM